MSMVEAAGKAVKLEPLGSDNWDQVTPALGTDDVIRRSLLCPGDFTFMFNTERLRSNVADPHFEQANKLFLIRGGDGRVQGLIGVADIDWVQRRGYMLLLMAEAALREKKSYEPVKLLLKKYFIEWDMRRLVVPVFKSDTAMATMLKGFGFSQEGVLREQVFSLGESSDVCLFGALKKEFRWVDV